MFSSFRSRKNSWSLYAGISFAVVLTAWVSFDWTDDRALLERLIPWETVPTQLLVVFSLVQYVRDCRPTGARGNAWRLLLAGCCLNLFGCLTWVHETAGFEYGLNDLFFGSCIVMFALAAAMFFIDLGGSFRRPQVWLDAATLMMALGAMLWQLWIGPAVQVSSPSGIRLIVPLGYAFGTTSMLVFAVLAYMRIRDWRSQRSLALLLGGAILNFLADVLWVDVIARGQLTAAAIYQLAYCYGDLLLLGAIVLERRRPVFEEDLAQTIRSPTSSIPAFVVLISIAVIVGEQAQAAGIRLMLPMMIAVLGAILVAIREIGTRVELYRDARTAAKREADERLSALVRRSRDVIVVVDSQHRMTYVSPAAERVLGVVPAALVGRNVESSLGVDNLSRISDFLSMLDRKPQAAIEIEVDFEHPGRGRRVLQIVGSNEGSESIIGGIALTMRDVSEQRNAERDLRAMSSRQQLALSHEIHEGLAQELTGIALLFQSLSRDASIRKDELTILETLPAQLSNAIDTARRLAASLAPLHAAQGSLEWAVRSLAEQERKSGRLDIRFSSNIGARDLPCALSEEAYRIVVEALECATLDPSSSMLKIDLSVLPDVLQIRLDWDSDPRIASSSASSDLLRIIGHRVRRLRGALFFDHTSGRGLGCVAAIPLRFHSRVEETTFQLFNRERRIS